MMIKQKIVIAVFVAVGMFTASACTNTARQEKATTEPTQPTAQPSQPATGQGQSTTGSNQNALSSSEREFVTQVVQDSMAEVQLGQLASQRALRDEVKQFGQRMVRDHTQVHNELKQLAAQKGITLPQDSGDEHREVMENLSKLSGADFDRAYMNSMATEDLSSFEREAQQGQDQDLKAWTTKTLPMLQEHLRVARSITGNTAGTSSP